MSFNKWKSTTVYGIFNNKDLTDASLNVITPCEATFDGQLTANTITSTTDINAVDGNFSNDVGIGNHLSVNSVSVNLSVEANEMNANTQISCNGNITGNTLGASTTIQGGSLYILGTAEFDGDLTCNGDIYCVDMSSNSIHTTTINGTTLNGTTINGTTLNVTTLNATDINFTGAVTSDDTISGNVLTSTTAVNCVTLNADVINCSDLLDINRIDALEMNTDVLNANETIGCDVFTCNEIHNNGYTYIEAPLTVISSSFSGTIVASMPFRGQTYKKVIIWCDESIGSTTYTFPTAFYHLPRNISGNSGQVTALSTTAVTITTNTSTSVFIILEGF